MGRVSQSPVCALRPCLCSLYENKIYPFCVVIPGNGCRAFLSKPLIQNPKHISTASETTAIPVVGEQPPPLFLLGNLDVPKKFSKDEEREKKVHKKSLEHGALLFHGTLGLRIPLLFLLYH